MSCDRVVVCVCTCVLCVKQPQAVLDDCAKIRVSNWTKEFEILEKFYPTCNKHSDCASGRYCRMGSVLIVALTEVFVRSEHTPPTCACSGFSPTDPREEKYRDSKREKAHNVMQTNSLVMACDGDKVHPCSTSGCEHEAGRACFCTQSLIL